MAPTHDMDDSHRLLFESLASQYELQGVIGQGAMGTVYLAHDRKHDRLVAIKTIQPDFVSEAGRRRFEQEIKVTARLQHPHILPLLDSGLVDGVLYYVMQFVEGESLQERLEREKQLPIEEALRIAREVADALSHAHALKVIHRDIKPSNIMLSGGHAFVMDFGIARAVSDTSRGSLTGTGMAMGTPHYMAPEQAVDASAADGRADVYALGCVLYEMLAGQPPFTGSTVEAIIHQHMSVPPPAITNHRPAVPAEVVAVLARALAKSPADRFSPAAQFGEALRHPSLRGALMVAAPWKARNTLLVVGIYVAGAWGLLEVVERIARNTALPGWVEPLALVLLLIGLPIVLVTALVQAAASKRRELSDPTTSSSTSAAGVFGSATPAPEPLILSLFTWRNVVAGGVLALAFWGIVTTSWLVWFRDPTPAEASPQALTFEDEPEGEAPEAASADPVLDADDPVGTTSQEAGGRRPEPPVQPGPDPAQRSFVVARAATLTAREAADEADAASARPDLAAVADSLWDAAMDAASVGRYTVARGLMELAGEQYDQTRLAATATWRSRVDTARADVTRLREAADPNAPSYAEAEREWQEAGRAENAGDYATALARLRSAGAAYRNAQTLDAPEPQPPAPSEPAEVSSRDRVQGVLSELEAALESEDIARLRAVWLNLTTDEIGNFQRSFDRLDDIRVTLEPQWGTLTVSEGGISVVVGQHWQFQGGELPSPPQRFQIAERGGRWVIIDVR